MKMVRNNKSKSAGVARSTARGRAQVPRNAARVRKSAPRPRRAPDNSGYRTVQGSRLQPGHATMDVTGPGRAYAFDMNNLKEKYMTCVIDPFSDKAKGASLMVNNSGPSYKASAMARFTVTIGANGTGQIAISPTFENNSVTCVYSSSTAYVSASVQTAYAGAGIVAGLSTVSLGQLPYTATQIETDKTVAGRIVSAGVRVTYTGDPLYRRGTIYSFVSPDRESVIGSSDTAGIAFGSQPTASLLSLSDIMSHSFCEVQYPILNSELQYNVGASATLTKFPFAGTNTFTSGENTASTACIWITGGNSGQTLTCEYIVHVEYVGRIAAPFYSVTDTAVDFHNRVAAKAGELMLAIPGNPRFSRSAVFQRLMKAGRNLGKRTLRRAGQAALSSVPGGSIAGELLRALL